MLKGYPLNKQQCYSLLIKYIQIIIGVGIMGIIGILRNTTISNDAWMHDVHCTRNNNVKKYIFNSLFA